MFHRSSGARCRRQCTSGRCRKSIAIFKSNPASPLEQSRLTRHGFRLTTEPDADQGSSQAAVMCVERQSRGSQKQQHYPAYGLPANTNTLSIIRSAIVDKCTVFQFFNRMSTDKFHRSSLSSTLFNNGDIAIAISVFGPLRHRARQLQ